MPDRPRPRAAVVRAALLAAALATSGLPAPAGAQAPGGNGPGAGPEGRVPALPPAPSFGPLTAEEAGPLQRVSLNPASEGADLLPAGRFQAEAWMGYANIFEQDSAATHELFLDLERLAKRAGVRWGVTDRLEVGGRLSFETTGGGILDAFITGWHGKLGVGNGNREKYPYGVHLQRLSDANGEVRLDVPARTLALEDVRVFAKWRAWRSTDGRALASLRGVARLPTQDGIGGGRRADVALLALGRVSWTRWHLHGSLGGGTVRAARDAPGLLRGGAFFADVALERKLAPWVSGVVQLSAASPRFRGFGDPELDGWPVNLVFGATGALGDGWLLEVSFQEDIPPNTPAVDFTLGVGVRRSW